MGMKLSENADNWVEAIRLGIRAGDRVRITVGVGQTSDDAFIVDIGQTGLLVRIGKTEHELDWGDVVQLRKIEII